MPLADCAGSREEVEVCNLTDANLGCCQGELKNEIWGLIIGSMWSAILDILKLGAFGWVLAAVWGAVWVTLFGGGLDEILDTAWTGFLFFALCATAGILWSDKKQRAGE
jgi:hypothetical protein